MKIKYFVGDATQPVPAGFKSSIIAHICNDSGGWGRGFVLALSERWPISKKASSPEHCYREWRKRNYNGNPMVLGQIQTIWVEQETYVCNMIAQRDYKPLVENGVVLGLPNVNYTSLLECLTRLRVGCMDKHGRVHASVHMPRIGAGLGGGNWVKIEKIINCVFENTEIPVYIYDLEQVEGTTYFIERR